MTEFVLPSTKLNQEPLQQNHTALKTNLGKRDSIFHIPSTSIHVIDQNTKNSFIYTALTAWSEHYPLVLTPDDIWLLVLQGVAREVNENSEELRHKVVGPCSVGKKAIIIEVPFNMTTADYEEVGDQFRKAIGSETNPDFLDLINTGFSTTTVTDQMVNCVTVMDMCSKYFGYVMSTKCGFPSIVLEGTEEDWVQLRARAERLISGYCTDATRKRWGAALFPVLDRFVQARINSNNQDEKFWNSMIKIAETNGSGGRTYYNGWINVFFPYLCYKKTYPNPYCVPYSTEQGYGSYPDLKWEGPSFGGPCIPFKGTIIEEFPNGISEACVVWIRLGEEIKLRYLGGFLGSSQCPETMRMRTVRSWVIVHDNKTEQEEQECESSNCTNVSKYYKAIKPRDKPYPQRDSLVFND